MIGLNPRQLDAVKHTKGPLLIIAGAGSGKTKALTHRVAYLIHEKKVPAANVLAVTFTNKAAGEMRDRVRVLLGGTKELPYIGTFHSLGVRILRKEITNLGYQSHFAIYDDTDQIALIKTVLQGLNLDPKQFNPHMLAGLIGQAKNELLDPEQIAKRANDFFQEVLAKVYKRYQAELKEANACDFDDLLMLTVRIFQKFPKQLAYYQNKFKYIHVDEYQDTNHAQYVLVKLLAQKHRNVAVVGDDWQAIYGWRGADLRNILDFERDYPEAKIVMLEQNYRSTQIILDGAGAVIAKNTEQKSKKLWTKNAQGDLITVHMAHDERDEAEYIVRQIKQALKNKPKLKYNDIVVLYRTNAQSRPLEEACLAANLPYRIVGGVKFYDRKEVKDVLAYLKFLANPNDLMAFERLINTPQRGLGPRTRERILALAKDKFEGDLLKAMLDAPNFEELDLSRAQTVRELGLKIDKIKKRIKDKQLKRVAKIIDLVIRDFNFEKFLRDGSEEGEMRYENIRELLTVANDKESLEDFLEEVALVSDIDEFDERSQALTLMTLHAAKGLEFVQVYLIGLEEGIFPHSRSLLEPKQLAEERRLCYVGMTRAKQCLHLVYANQRQLYGETQVNLRSRFLEDIPKELVEFTGGDPSGVYLDTKGQDQPWSDDFSIENPFCNGDNVEHPSFGSGKVINVEDDLVEVAFKKGGKKTLSVNFAPLKKVS